MNDDNSMVPAGPTTFAAWKNAPFAPARESVFPSRFYDLGEDSLIELWDLQGAGRPESLVYSTAGLEARIGRESCVAPGAFIFHCSRCGSTLLARLFAAAAGNRVFNEPDVFHQFRDARWNRISTPESLRALKVLVEAHGLGPAAGESRLIIKFDSRAVQMVEGLRQCFPAVPFIYLLRDPVDVVASLSASPPGFLGPGDRAVMAATFGGVEGAATDYPQEEWYAWYVERNLRLALQQASCFSAVIDYEFSASRYLEIVNRISGSQLRKEDAPIQAELSRHSKNPEAPFSTETNARNKTTAEIQESAKRIAGKIYDEWEKMTSAV